MAVTEGWVLLGRGPPSASPFQKGSDKKHRQDRGFSIRTKKKTNPNQITAKPPHHWRGSLGEERMLGEEQAVAPMPPPSMRLLIAQSEDTF